MNQIQVETKPSALDLNPSTLRLKGQYSNINAQIRFLLVNDNEGSIFVKVFGKDGANRLQRN